MAVMLSGVLMLRHLEEVAAADALEGAIANVIALGQNVTYDLKEKRNDPTAVGTSQVADAVIAQLKAGAWKGASEEGPPAAPAALGGARPPPVPRHRH